MPDLQTQRTETIVLGSCAPGTRVSLTLQWMLELEEDVREHPITAYNAIEVKVCGQEGFASLAADIEGARQSVEMACWGFDPGMELQRSGEH